MEGVDPGRSLVLLSLLAALCSVAGASGCRYHETGCADPSSCWKGGKNTTVPADCKCCVGYPYHPRGECRRWVMAERELTNEVSHELTGLPVSETARGTPTFMWWSFRIGCRRAPAPMVTDINVDLRINQI